MSKRIPFRLTNFDPGSWLLLGLLGPALVAGAVVLLSTPHGLGVSDDSVVYIGEARNFALGDGLSRLTGDGSPVPISHFPPLYPGLLGVAKLLGANVEAAARWLAVLSASVSVAFIVSITRRIFSSEPAAALAGWLMALSPIALEVHTWVMTESLYVALSLSTVFLLIKYLRSWRRGMLIAAGLAAGAALLTRYVGYALIVACFAALLLSGRAWRKRLADVMIFAAPVVIPLSLWSIRNLRLTGTAANRGLVWHPPAVGKLGTGLRAVAEWVYAGTPETLLSSLPAVGLIVGVWVFYLLWSCPKRRSPSGAEDRTLAGVSTLASYPLLYAAFLLVSISLFDRSTPLDRRLLFPAYPWLVMIGAIAFVQLWRWQQSRPLHALMLLVLSLGILRYSAEVAQTVVLLRKDARGFAASGWQTGAGIDYLRQLSEGELIYTNEPEPIYYLLDRGAYIVPIRHDGVTGEDRSDYPKQLERYQDRVLSGQAVLALYPSISFQSNLAPLEVLTAELRVVAGDERLTVYAANSD
jgi:hypothetical protein